MNINPQIIILNGTSSAGKTSIAQCLQDMSEGPHMHFQMDAFWDMVPDRFPDNSQYFPNMKYAICESAQALAQHGHNLIIDIVCPPDHIAYLLNLLKEYRPFVVAVKTDLPVLETRESKRTDRDAGLARSQYGTLHGETAYDLEVDSGHKTPQDCANLIYEAVNARNNGP